MTVAIVNEDELTAYLNDFVFDGQSCNFDIANLNNVDFVSENKDQVVRFIMSQYFNHQIKDFILSYSAWPWIKWVPNIMTQHLPENEQNCRYFSKQDIPNNIINEFISIRDFLYVTTLRYVDKKLAVAKQVDNHNRGAFKISPHYLKTHTAYRTYQDVLSASDKWHTSFKGQKTKHMIQILKDSQNGTQLIMALDKDFFLYRLTTVEALDFEGEHMNNCVGAGSYDKGIASGETEIYSIRDMNGYPHVTFEVKNKQMLQCKGKNNMQPLLKYVPLIQKTIRTFNWELVGDKEYTFLIFQNGQYYDLFNLPKEGNFVVEEKLDLSRLKLKELPDLSNVICMKSFDCGSNELTNLKNSPQLVMGSFLCSNNNLTSLKGVTQKIGESFICSHNLLETLDDGPKEVGYNYVCSWNKLTRLNCPKEIGGCFDCSHNELKSLIGAPFKIGWGLDVSCNQLTSLEGAPQNIPGYFNVDINPLPKKLKTKEILLSYMRQEGHQHV